jgi:neutral ceramidase
VRENLDQLVDGIVRSIIQAHNNVKPANAFVNEGDIEDGNINRSPTAYLMNPKKEREMYTADTDHLMVLLKFLGADNSEIGMLNWFAVHGTSMNNTNQLISGDNKGFASYQIEKAKNGGLPGKGPFVAAFAQTNLGDVSPNTNGTFCLWRYGCVTHCV